MAPPKYFGFRKVLALYLLVSFLFASVFCLCACSTQPQLYKSNRSLAGLRRRLLRSEEEAEKEYQVPIEKKTNTATTTLSSTKNKTNLIKPNLSQKNQTKPIKTDNFAASKNQTNLYKTSSNPTKIAASTIQSKAEYRKLNSTSKFNKPNPQPKPSNPTKTSSSSANTKSSDPDLKQPVTPKNKTTKTTASKQLSGELETSNQNKIQKTQQKKPNSPKPKKLQIQPSWIDQDDEDEDFVSDLKDLPTRFHQTLIPDLERFSTTSKAYISKANKQITKNFKPYVGNKYAPVIATLVSCAFLLIPLILVSLLFNRIKAYFSLQKLIIFIQVYLSIYFSILCFSSLATGLEPLKFFYATSQPTYVCLQVIQTLGYVLYLLLLLMYLVLVFSTDCGVGLRFLGLAQTFVGFAVGLHYYMKVFHRMVLHQPPKTNWKVHGIYASCFLVICLCNRAERRKKAYLEEGGEEGKQS